MAFGSVTATLTGLDPFNIRVAPGQGTLNFTPVPANSQVTSTNTFTIIVDPTVPLELPKLQWSFKRVPRRRSQTLVRTGRLALEASSPWTPVARPTRVALGR